LFRISTKFMKERQIRHDFNKGHCISDDTRTQNGCMQEAQAAQWNLSNL
jgi:hypothetical protein